MGRLPPSGWACAGLRKHPLLPPVSWGWTGHKPLAWQCPSHLELGEPDGWGMAERLLGRDLSLSVPKNESDAVAKITGKPLFLDVQSRNKKENVTKQQQ